MYPSGRWDGFWVHSTVGRGPMEPLTLRFAAGAVTGDGRDVVGPFTFFGEYDEATGEVRMAKQYLGKHCVLYVGRPDGEGSIQGTWSIGPFGSGPFLLRPVIARPSGDEPIQEIG
ncbi:hypothetical protein [Frigoriglobus tundricola]|uniref:Uncharacterized protein n=1 Tax=Frigoriglobus tundricola TaxID=2774151 RepID=A0A6M5YJ49_9BACT|nr:hypothetical protein [Frigoriglobus tundricola]QJW94079.1 hypothetical protein FTUN_1598 [Frigoriglobus tundricola]